ncbi:helix-turn-helix domain-containing protein [Candidatus Roizmanbacteria bacterium]|nr:helix-turn-helix domain-containing protein [Candidatus Roizmanbacteria bacterium]
MLNTNTNLIKAYTPNQVARMLQLSKNTVYELINRGEIVAKKIGKVYRIPAISLSFLFTGMDEDIYQMQLEDEKNIRKVEKALRDVRKEIWAKLKSF